MHVGSVGKSPTGIFTGITVRESTEGQSQVFGMWGKLQAIEKANSSCQCQEEQRSPRMQFMWERCWKVITLNPPGVQGLALASK